MFKGLGHTGYMADEFFNFHLQRNRAILGLSATPRQHDLMQICCEYSYSQLARDGYLAQPIVHQVGTGVTWSPLVRQNGIIIEESFNQLAQFDARNDSIVDTLIAGIGKGIYNRVLMFACNIDHAEKLASMLSKKGVSARAVHCLINDLQEKRGVIEQFRKGEVHVLVNVQMLTHGIDIPEIDTVVLARPTQSEILCAQMVGRGARVIRGVKDKFIILEFTDNIQNHGDIIFHAKGLFDIPPPPVNQQGPISPTPDRSVSKHFISDDAPKFERLLSVPGVEGVTFVADQTFGVEIELTSESRGTVPYGTPYWNQVACQIIKKLVQQGLGTYKKPGNYHDLTNINQWKVEADSSVGWEVISPILAGQGGFEELFKACKALSKFCEDSQDITINYRTGLHITLATKLNSDVRLRGFLKRVQRLEPGLFSLVAPSRLFKFDGKNYQVNEHNVYCVPIRHINVDNLTLEDFLDEYDNRYYSVNIMKSQDDPELLEVRMHSGTTDYCKIIPWISLWMNIFNHSRYEWKGKGIQGDVFKNNVESNDLFKLLKDEEIFLPFETMNFLYQRRKEMKKHWAGIVPTLVESWERAGWYKNIGDNQPVSSVQTRTSNLSLEDYAPQNCRSDLLREFETLVKSGGEVDSVGLTDRIKRAKKLVFLYHQSSESGTSTLAGIAELKCPDQNYKKYVFKVAVSEQNSSHFVYELGWIFIKDQFRGHKYSETLLKYLLDLTGHDRVYSTVREDNNYMRRSSEKCGFKISGQPYLSSNGNYKLVLYVK